MAQLASQHKAQIKSLEMTGLFLLLLTIPEIPWSRHLALGVNNKSVVHTWRNKSCNGHITASVLARALLVVTSHLECRLYVEHVMRNSTTESFLADCLTRDSTAHKAWPHVEGAITKDPPEILWDWLKNPEADWQLGFKLVDNIKKKL